MMQSPVITRVVNRIQTPLTMFQDFLGLRTGSPGTDVIKGRDAGWDIFDRTRTFAHGRAPDVGPEKVAQKPSGHQSAQLFRSHESTVILDNEVYKTRPLGAQIGSTVDLRGRQYIARQIGYITQRMRNQREWMMSRLFRGGFNIERAGDTWKLKNYNTSAADEIQVNYQLPATSQDKLDLGTGADILTEWTTSADVADQLLKINAAFTRIHGRALKHVWVNSTALTNLLNNTKLQAQGGTANIIFRQFLRNEELSSADGVPNTGFDVVFRSVPWVTFHVYDGVMSSDGDVDGTSTTDMAKLIPDDKAIFLPDPDMDWVGLVEGTEVVSPNVMSAGREQVGFGSWATRVIDPPGFELKMIDNYLPVLYVPTCVAYGDIGA
jgi:hypothetical protein